MKWCVKAKKQAWLKPVTTLIVVLLVALGILCVRFPLNAPQVAAESAMDTQLNANESTGSKPNTNSVQSTSQAPIDQYIAGKGDTPNDFGTADSVPSTSQSEMDRNQDYIAGKGDTPNDFGTADTQTTPQGPTIDTTQIRASYVPSSMKITLTVPSNYLSATSKGTEAWTKTWNQITALDYPEFAGGAPTFCDSNDFLSMGLNATNGKAPNDLPGLFPVWCGNSKYVWQCTSDNFQIVTGGNGAMSLQIQCYPPESQDDIDNGHVTHADGTSGAVVTKEVYKQWQEERGISYEDSVGTSGGSQSIEDQCETSLSGFGWLICPAVGLLSDFTDQFYGWINDSLQWTLLTNPDINSGVRNTWQQFLNIANILFAVVVMIYSMATSTGLSNYDVKKMLPRLIVVAIAVNTSFYLCAALVDISNIVGSGVRELVGSIGSATYVSPGSSPWDLVSGVAAVIAIAISAILFLGSGIAALIIIFASIIFRQMALVLIIVISPLAIVCYMLPNTQKWFQQWWNMFVKLLLVYPMFGLVWGASQGLAGLLAATTTSVPPFIFSLVALIIPAVSIIPLFKMSGGLMAMATGAVAGSALARNAKSRINTGVQNRGKRAYHNSMLGRGIDRHRERVKDLDKQVNEGSYAGYNPWRRARQAVNRGVNRFRVIGGAKGVSSDKDLGNFLKNYTYVDGDGNVQHLTDDQMLDYIQGRAAEDANGNVILAAQNLNAEQIGSGIKALSGSALEDISGKNNLTKNNMPPAATDASRRYARLQATSNMHEIYAKHGIDIGKDVDNAYEQMYEIGVNGSYTDKNGTVHTVSSAAQNDVATMMSHFDANAGSANAEKIFNEEAKTFRAKRQSSAIKTTISGFTDAAAKRESDDISQALGSAMKAREFKKNAFKSGASTPPTNNS